MKDKSIRCALWLKKQGIGKEDIVVIATPIQKDDYVPFLATLFVNAIYNPWFNELSPGKALVQQLNFKNILKALSLSLSTMTI